MSKGYVTLARTERELECAELLCNSIKIKNKDAKFTVVTDLKVESTLFDSVEVLPFNTEVTATRQNDWQLYWASPYEYTIAIDCNSIVMENQDNLWDYLIENHSVCFPTKCYDFRMDTLFDKKYKKWIDYTFRKVYSNMFFFDKSEESLRYFKLLDPMCQNWRDTEYAFLQKQHTNKSFDQDTIHTLAANHSDIDVFPLHDNILSYIDMKTMWEDGVLPDEEDWTKILSVWSTQGKRLKLQNYSINNTLYYYENNFYSEKLANEYRTYRQVLEK